VVLEESRTTKTVPVSIVRGRSAELTVLGQHPDQLLSDVGAVVLVQEVAEMAESRLLIVETTECIVVRIARKLLRGAATRASFLSRYRTRCVRPS
jgi:hypothetical protein